MRHSKHLVRWLAVLLTLGLLAAACGDDEDAAGPDAAAAPEATAAPSVDAPAVDEPGAEPVVDEAPAPTTTALPVVEGELAGVCPSPLVVQTDWFPESEHGAMYELVGDDYVVDVDNKVVRGTMVLGGTELGIEWEVRTGGPAIGFSPVSQHMAVDDSIQLGYASTDQQINHWDVAPLMSVVAPLERNPQMVMWDPDTYPNIEGIADLGDAGVTIQVFGGGTFPEVFIAQGIWSRDQVDPSYNGQPARWVSEGGAIAQQGFASSEVYTYEFVFEEWAKPVAFQLLHDAGFQIYSQTVGIRPGDLEALRPCLEKVVPIIQQAAVDFDADPARANAIIVDAVLEFDAGWEYPADLAAYSVQAQRDFALVGDGPDSVAGNMEAERYEKTLADMRAAGMDIDADLTADQLFTNEFIDESISFGFGDAPAQEEMMMEPLGDGSLGVVEVEAGDAIQIRSLEAITGDPSAFGLPIDRATYLAVEDYGQIHGFDVDLGTSLDDTCSNDGGQASAQIIVADEDVVGVIGTSCSGAAVAAAPLITDAGMVLISGGNTSPALTSDLAGTPGENYSVGYYRTAHNDLYQGAAVAKFVFSELGITEAAAIHDGDPYTQGLAQAFRDAFEREGGTMTGFSAVNKGDSDMVPVLTEIAAHSPGALFFPIFQPEGDFIAEQAPGVPGLEGTVLLAADGLLVDRYLALPQTADVYFSGPDERFGDNTNQSTGKTAAEILAAYEEAYGESPSASFWAHGYDATTLLLDAIKAASWVEDGTLMIDRQGIRDYLNGVRGYSGVIGTINCDDFGDCGSSRITIVRNIGGEENVADSRKNVVFSYAP